MRIQRASLLPIFLVGFASGAIAQGNTCATATPITVGSYTNMTVSYPNSHYYEMTVPPGQMFVFTETRDTNDCIYSLWEEGCLTGVGGSAEPGLNEFSWANTSGSATTIVVQAYNWDNSFPHMSTYDFDVRLDPVPCTGDAFEVNDNCATAYSVSVGSYTGLQIGLGELDYFKVDVPVGHQVVVKEVVDNHENINWRIWGNDCQNLIGSGASGVAWSNDTNTSQEIVFSVQYDFTAGDPNCSTYDFEVRLSRDPCDVTPGSSGNTDCSTALPLADGMYLGQTVKAPDSDCYSFNVRAGATVSIDVLQSGGVVAGFLRAANSTACGTGYNGMIDMLAIGFGAHDYQMSWTNTTGFDLDLVLEIEVGNSQDTDCNAYDLVLSGTGAAGGGEVGPVFCSNMDVNSTGASTRLAGYWGTGMGSDLHLEVSSGPVNQLGYFLVGTGVSDPGLTVSQGRMCLSFSGGNSFGRYNVAGGGLNSFGQFDANGIMQNASGTSSMGSGFDVPLASPILGSPAITSGSTLHFQFWHREAGGASNFSNGLSATF